MRYAAGLPSVMGRQQHAKTPLRHSVMPDMIATWDLLVNALPRPLQPWVAGSPNAGKPPVKAVYGRMNGVRSPTDPSINGMLLITSFTASSGKPDSSVNW